MKKALLILCACGGGILASCNNASNNFVLLEDPYGYKSTINIEGVSGAALGKKEVTYYNSSSNEVHLGNAETLEITSQLGYKSSYIEWQSNWPILDHYSNKLISKSFKRLKTALGL